jgi:galactonate dehydratase
MKITKLETIWFETVPGTVWHQRSPDSRQTLSNNHWVRVYSDDGLVVLGETYYLPRAVISIMDDLLGPLLIGRDVFNIEKHLNKVLSLVNFCGFAGAKMRGVLAIDVALWDLLDQYTGQPIYSLLGGRSPDYNTCVGYGNYPDDNLWTEGRAGELAQDLLNMIKWSDFHGLDSRNAGSARIRDA